MEIKINEKFTQKDLDAFIEKYLNVSLETTDSEIIFNLEQLEWISAEEIAFLFSLMRQFVLKKKNVKVKMPITSKIFEGDNDETMKRRRIANMYLYRDWKMFQTGVKDYNFINLVSSINELIDKKESSNKTNKILPFQIIPTDRDSEEAVDSRFYQQTREHFRIDNVITNLLNNNNCYSPFENKVISDIITKELFMNSAEHAQTDESYFATALREKWKFTHTPNFVDSFITEKDEATIDFYKDKDKILPIIKNEALKIAPERIKEKIVADLTKKQEYNIFKNQSYLEFTFIDFGCGIFETLKDEYNNKREDAIDNLSKGIKEKHPHSQILEYAFLMDSSKDPFENRIERADLIPRGLYFLIDMVRRYKGLLVARSGYGKVIYDFSDRIYIESQGNELSAKKDRIYVAKDAVVPSVNNGNPFFAGTMISIVLPEREKGKFRKSGVRIDDYKLNYDIFNQDKFDFYPKEQFAPKFYDYLHLAFSIYVSETNDEIHGFNSKFSTAKGQVNLAFIQISNKLKLLNEKSESCVLFIDFEYFPKRNMFNKIYTYLQNSPLISERIKVIAVNVDENELNALKETKYQDNASFLLKAIPCIKLNKLSKQDIDKNDIQWIGVDDKDDDMFLTELLFNSDKSIDKLGFKNQSILEGNVISTYQGKAISIFSDFNNLIDRARIARENAILEWINDDIVKDGETPTEKHKEKRLFLTSKGTYQTKYLSFYDTLTFKYSSLFFARFLLDKYIDTFNTDKLKFDQILAVTVSSQLLAIEIRSLIREDDAYSFLRKNGSLAKDITDCPSLIKLSSYFSFEEEKPFKDIQEGQKILIVNDVISTGSLIERLVKGIEKKKATITGILAITDTRKRDVDETIEYPSVFFDGIGIKEIENKIISIISSEQNSTFIIEKFKYKPQGTETYKIKRINPVLNSIVTLNSKHTEKNKILFENPKKFIELVNSEIFQIGHFKQSLLSCSSYFTDMYALLRNEQGIKLLEECKNRIDNKLIEKGFNKCMPFFIFHPVHSGIEQISEDTYSKVFETNKANIIGLQRYQTPLGWRFVFPPKRFNDVLKEKPILIIDSGTLSGQSLIQLIDAVSVYEVSRIDVLIVIGRLDDFQREFYSRLQKIKVKTKIDDEETDNEREVLVPLNIFFGTNLHIPSYQTEDMCPFCKELILLNECEHKDYIPKEAKSHIEKRKEDIKKQENGKKFTPEYIPRDKITGQCDLKNIFLMRDELGKIDGYRFYEDYFSRNDDSEEEKLDDLCNRYPNEEWENLFNPENKEDLKKIEQVLICILHEPNLVSTIKDLLVNLFDIEKKIIDVLIKDNGHVAQLNYDWSKYAILKVYYALFYNKQDFYEYSNIQLIFDFCEEDKDALNYLSFLLWNPSEFKEQKRKVLDEFSKELYETDFSKSNSHTLKRTLIRNMLSLYPAIDSETTVAVALYNLKRFYDNTYTNNHDSLLRSNIRQINARIKNNKFEEVNSIIADNITEVNNKFEKGLWQYLCVLKESQFCCKAFESKLIGDNSIFEQLRQLVEIYKDIKDVQSNPDFNDSTKYKDSIFEKIQNYFDKIRYTIEPQHLLPTSDFINTFVKNYTFKPHEMVEELCQSSDIITLKEQLTEFHFNNNTDKDLILEGRQCLQYVFREIIENSVKRKEHDNTTLSFQSVKLEEKITIIITQSKPYLMPDDKEEKEQNGGFAKNVKGVMALGFGTVEDNKDDKMATEYIIKLIFKIITQDGK
jgi:adenine/guanine phosphoribosyltransferase-like PRPP-binding protein